MTSASPLGHLYGCSKLPGLFLNSSSASWVAEVNSRFLMKTSSSQSVASRGGKLSSFLSPSQRALRVASSAGSVCVGGGGGREGIC